MSEKCTVIDQGYGNPTETIIKCLPNTGQDLLPFIIFAIITILLGIVLWYMSRRRGNLVQ